MLDTSKEKMSSTHTQDCRELVFGEADTVGDSVTDDGEDLLDLVLRLDVVDCTSIYDLLGN